MTDPHTLDSPEPTAPTFGPDAALLAGLAANPHVAALLGTDGTIDPTSIRHIPPAPESPASEAPAAPLTPADASTWLDTPMQYAMHPAAIMATLHVAQLAYEVAQHDAGAAADAFYRHDDAGTVIEADTIAEIMQSGIAATPAAKAAKTAPSMLAWATTRATLAAAKARTEQRLSIARRRHTLLLTQLHAFASIAGLSDEIAALLNPSDPETDGQ